MTITAPNVEITKGCILQPMALTMGYGELLAKDITDAQFAQLTVKGMNHAAFQYGHLAVYPARIATLLGCDGAIAAPAGYEAMYAQGCPCIDDPARYHPREEILHHWRSGYAEVAALIADAPLSRFEQANPIERMRERFPLAGMAVSFLCNNHQMMHLGGVSTWRRTIGLGSAM
ncbi:MAG: DinB family protein [Planctomycetota bacterium]|nr:DinB family protein [Planctomycetota bacterium]